MKSAALLSDRVITLLESYGGNPDAWPEAERLSAEQCIAQSEQLQSLQREAQQLDQAVSAIFVNEQYSVRESELKNIKQRIFNQLPRQQAPNINQKAPFSLNLFWRRFFVSDYPLPVVLGSIALVMSITLIMEKPDLTNTSLSYAEYQALILESYSETEETIPLSNELQMLAFLEPELFDE